MYIDMMYSVDCVEERSRAPVAAINGDNDKMNEYEDEDE